jgi:hypothetical protein
VLAVRAERSLRSAAARHRTWAGDDGATRVAHAVHSFVEAFQTALPPTTHAHYMVTLSDAIRLTDSLLRYDWEDASSPDVPDVLIHAAHALFRSRLACSRDRARYDDVAAATLLPALGAQKVEDGASVFTTAGASAQARIAGSQAGLRLQRWALPDYKDLVRLEWLPFFYASLEFFTTSCSRNIRSVSTNLVLDTNKFLCCS